MTALPRREQRALMVSKQIDDATVQFTTKEEMSLTTFENSYARYLMTLPKHVIEQYTEEELKTAEWFNHPDVVSRTIYGNRFRCRPLYFL